MTVKEMREQRASLVNEVRAASDPATQERGWNEVDRLGESIDKQERRDALAKAFAEKATNEKATAWRSYVARGPGNLTPNEQRALAADANTLGGYMVAPEETLSQVITALDNIVAIRALATKHVCETAESLGVPSVDVDVADADWCGEIATVTEDTALAFGSRELNPNAIAKFVKASGKLVRRAKNASDVIMSRLAYKFAVTEEKAFLTGTGVKQPLGLFTASGDGVPTTRDVSTGNSTTAITMDGLVNAMYSLKSQLLSSPSCRWIFHRDAVKMIRKLRAEDGGADTGSYLWQPSVVAGQPDTLLGVPVISSEYAPATFEAGLYVGLIGDLSAYVIADALRMSILRLSEKYAATDEVAFIGRLETDGMPALADAFARVQLAAA